MRLFHTADWHLGQSLFNYDRYYEHGCFLDWLLDQLEDAQPDALLIAGDIFDNSNPSAESQRQFYQFLRNAQRRTPQINIILIAGNHDSPARLEAPAPVLNTLGVTVVGSIPRTANGAINFEQLITPITNAHQDILGYCIAIPFTRPGDIPHAKEGALYIENMKAFYQRLLESALHRKENHHALISLGHCNIHGSQISPDSERKTIIGGLDALPVEIFDPGLDYVALGHLHRAQKVAGNESIRYSGSPLPMSFTEIHYPHQILNVEIQPGTAPQINPILVPRPVEFLRIPEKPALLSQVLANLWTFFPPERNPEAYPYLQVPVQLNGLQLELSTQIEDALKNKCVRLAKIDLQRPVQKDSPIENTFQSLDDLMRIRPDDIFRDLYSKKYGVEPAAELRDAFNELWQKLENNR